MSATAARRPPAASDAALHDTPALVVDLDAVERNIARLQAHCDREGLALRPHIKTHKLPQLSRLQVDAGAVGLTCQKLGEAEVMLDAGFDDLLLSFPLVGGPKLPRLSALAGRARVSVVADSAQVLRPLAAAMAAAGVEVGLLVECDTGFGRTGVQTPEAAAALAALSAELAGVRFDGLMTYPTPRDGGAWLRAARAACEARGLAVTRVSGGGTPNAFTSSSADGITELRAGTYVYGDRSCIAGGSVALEDCALRVHATVVSRPTAARAILDAGSKALTNDPAAGGLVDGHGLVVEYPEARIYNLSEEHGHVDVGPHGDGFRIGEVVTIVPNHACGATNLYDEIVVRRGASVVDLWPIAARGRSR